MYLVQKISTFEGLEIINPQIYSQYKDARRDLLSRLGEIFMDAYIDSDRDDYGNRDIRTGFELYSQFYIEAGTGASLSNIPADESAFKECGEELSIYIGEDSHEFISIKTIGRYE